MTVNVTAARLVTLACLPLIEASPLASVTFLLDHRPGAYWGAYGVSKQALHALMHMLDDEHEGRRDERGRPRVAINGYDPGPMRTALRRRAFPGELEREAPPPNDKLGPPARAALAQRPAPDRHAASPRLSAPSTRTRDDPFPATLGQLARRIRRTASRVASSPLTSHFVAAERSRCRRLPRPPSSR